MIDPQKLKLMTTAMRLLGFADGLQETRDTTSLRHLLNTAGNLLLQEWNIYAELNGYEILDANGKPRLLEV
jgi:hypothetical protein